MEGKSPMMQQHWTTMDRRVVLLGMSSRRCTIYQQ